MDKQWQLKNDQKYNLNVKFKILVGLFNYFKMKILKLYSPLAKKLKDYMITVSFIISMKQLLVRMVMKKLVK
jgi:hypothetical protein